MNEKWFRQEYMGEFVDVASCVFDRDEIEACFDNNIEPLHIR
jgi:hypothetical protein